MWRGLFTLVARNVARGYTPRAQALLPPQVKSGCTVPPSPPAFSTWLGGRILTKAKNQGNPLRLVKNQYGSSKSTKPIFSSYFSSVSRRHFSYQISNARRPNWRSLQYEPVLYTLMGLNAAVFMGWQMAPSFMLKHFAFSTESIRNMRPYTIVSAIFSQYEFGHLAANMLGLFFWGRDIGRALGGTRLLGLYLVGGVVGNLVQLGLSYSKEKQYRWGQPRPTYGLGASGAVNSIVSLSILLFPRETVLLYFVIPVPAALLGALFLLKDFSGLYNEGSSVSHAGHLGGASVGLAYWLMLKGILRR